MKKEGFTLIELLAVIVILAIIALITVPVVTSIINSSKNKTIETSVKNYVRAVENNLLLKEVEDSPVPNGTYEIMSNGNICIGGTVDNCTNIFEIEVEGNYPTQGTIILSNNKVISLIDVVFNNYLVNMNSNGEITIGNYSSTDVICKAVNSSQAGSTTLGTQYNCQVNDTTSYNFYVLSTSGDSVNLIMSKNLVDNVYFIDSSNYIVNGEWNEENAVTPSYYVTTTNKPYVITEVQNLTSTWTNIPNLNNYSYTLGAHGWGPVFGTITLTGKARLATFEEIANTLCKNQILKAEDDLSQYVEEDDPSKYYYSSCESWILGDYWTMTTVGLEGVWAMNANYKTLDSFQYYLDNNYNFSEFLRNKFGIRPVITVTKSNLG